MILPIVGLVFGIVLAWFMPAINYDYSKYLAIAVLACLDSVFGGFAGFAERKFDKNVFVYKTLYRCCYFYGKTFCSTCWCKYL